MIPVKIRGVLYRSIAEASRKLDLHPSTITYALDRGTIDACGITWSIRPCEIEGVKYNSLTEAARHRKVSVEAIRLRVNRAMKSKGVHQ